MTIFFLCVCPKNESNIFSVLNRFAQFYATRNCVLRPAKRFPGILYLKHHAATWKCINCRIRTVISANKNHNRGRTEKIFYLFSWCEGQGRKMAVLSTNLTKVPLRMAQYCWCCPLENYFMSRWEESYQGWCQIVEVSQTQKSKAKLYYSE